MPEATQQNGNYPPALERDASNGVTTESLAALIEWFLNYDERVAIIRHPHSEALFQWKQQDAQKFGEEIYPFPSAEDRFAVGIFQALQQYDSEPELHDWISDLLAALEHSKDTNAQVSEDYKFSKNAKTSPLDEAKLIPSTVQQRLYLTARWLETLCTAEVRVLGWIYQELYGRAYQPHG
jgi:hypothetical protein